MMFVRAIRDALLAIWTKKTRSILTMLGIIIGVSQIIALIGLGQGVKQEVSSEVTQLGSNLLFLLPGKVTSGSGGFNPSASLGASTLTEGDIAALRKLPDITESSIVSLYGGLPTVDTHTAPTALTIAVEPSYFNIMSNTGKLVAGRYFSDADNRAKSDVAVIGNDPKAALFPGVTNQDVLGKKIRYGKTAFSIIGVRETPPSNSAFGTSNTFSNAIFLPYASAKAANANTQIFRFALKVKDGVDVKHEAGIVKATMLELHGGTEDFTVFTQDDLLKVVDNILGVITKAIVGLASISLIVGGIGIMNIMLVSVTERTREIGLRKAIGATNWHILLQ
ncbi:MAG: ABC transporter permease, partial [Candidatus Kerfeldbacteria bacterium]|nr:ABC transporter permease [Candidatus Kerfeldbacteria bacterium]